ncbi:MAG TPA: phosphodiester glycosidase family protein [Longimicrobiales bacterium]
MRATRALAGAILAAGVAGACGAPRAADSPPAWDASREGATGGARPGAAEAEPRVPAVLLAADSLRAVPVAPGVRHFRAWFARGPWAVHVVEIDAPTCGPVFEARKAGPPASARATTSRLGAGAVVAVNADFFRLPAGTTVGAHVRGGEVVAGPGARPVLALGADGDWWIGRAQVNGEVVDARTGAVVPLVQVNRPTAADTAGAVLFTGWVGAEAPPDSGAATAVVRIVSGPAAGAGASGVVVHVDTIAAPQAIGPDAVVLRARGRAARRLRAFAPGDTVRWWVRLVPAAAASRGPERAAQAPRPGGDGAIARPAPSGRAGAGAAAVEAVGGFPVLLRGGALAPEIAEGVSPAFGERRHPRTAVGIAAGGRRVLWVVVDGRQEPYSAGMSLRELAELMRGLGAEDAINLDGGGSSTLVVDGAVANRPSDRTGERPVGNALALAACRSGGE